MTQLTKILIVDDDPIIRHLLSNLLQSEYHVTAVNCGQCAVETIAKNTFALALLDIHLEDTNGIDLLRVLKAKSPDTTFIMLTGQASLETAVAALRYGAHDYLQKPIQADNLRESLRKGLEKRQEILQNRTLLNQIRAVSNILEQMDAKQEQNQQPPPNVVQRFIHHRSLRIDLMRHRVSIDQKNIQLSPIEYKILVYLAEATPRVIAPRELVTAVQGHESEAWEASEIIRPHIYRIRQKIKAVAPQVEIVRTVRGIGYALCD